MIAIHTSPEALLNNMLLRNVFESLYSFAVSFFYITSGFFLWHKIYDAPNEEKLIRIKRWLLNVLRLYLVWTLIYMPFTVYGFYLDGISTPKAVALFIRNLLFVGENFYSWQLWYLLGLLVAGVLLYYGIRCKIPQTLICIIAGLLAIGGVVIDYCGSNNYFSAFVASYYMIFDTTRNGLFEGFPYLMMGVTIATSGIINSRKLLWLLLGVGFILHLFKFELSAFLMAYALFSLVLQVDLKDKNAIYNKIRLTSTAVYLVHMLWVGAFTFIVPIKNPAMLFMAVVLASFVSAYWVTMYKESRIIKILIG